jgi:3-oxoacyl-[acyl-carrier-protein] synthase III
MHSRSRHNLRRMASYMNTTKRFLFDKEAYYIHSPSAVIGEIRSIASVPELAADSERLNHFLNMGLQSHAVYGGSISDLALECLKKVLNSAPYAASEIDTILLCSSSYGERSFFIEAIRGTLLEAGLVHAHPIHISLSFCANVHTAIFTAVGLLRNEQASKILILSVDKTDAEVGSWIFAPNVTILSDGACGFIVSADKSALGIRGVALHSEPTLWGVDIKLDFLRYMKMTMSGARSAVEAVRPGPAPQIASFIVNNYNNSVMNSFAVSLGMKDVLFRSNLPKLAHCYASDNIINLLDALDEGELDEANVLMMGSSPTIWGATLLNVAKH